MFMIHFAGVLWKDWKAKDGECEEKCEGAAGPFFIVRECEDARCSCKGHKTTKETKECTTYCPSTGRMKQFYIIQMNPTVLDTADKVPLRGVCHCKFLLILFIYEIKTFNFL